LKVAIVHTDFRIYWPARLKALIDYLWSNEVSLEIIEIAGAGSPYYFANNSGQYPDNWHCLYPDKRMEDIPSGQAKMAVVKKLNEINPDLVISGPIAFPSGAGALHWSLENKKKKIVFDDARLIDVPRSRGIDFIKKKVYSIVDAILCPSPVWVDTFMYFGFRKEQLFYGIDVIDNSFWKIKGKSPNIIIPEHKYFLTVGRQVPKKNFLFLLTEYLNYALEVKNPIHLILIGEGPESDFLKLFISENNIQHLIHFFPFLPQTELRAFYENAVWFILPSVYKESWGLVVNEAMASGLPVIVSDQAGCASTLVHQEINGFTFSPEVRTGLTSLLLKAASMPEEERKEMGLQSETIISEWGLERFCSGVYEAINYVTSSEYTAPDLISKIIIKLWRGRYRPV
jgi:glycosyltransferase involved in cell wall biosynthesis